MNTAVTGRRTSATAGLVNMLFGIWVAFSPLLLGFGRNTAALWNNIAVGIALTLVAIVGEWVDGGFQALVVPLGVWLFASPFVLGFSSAAFLVNNVTMAFVVIAAGAISDGLR